MDNNSLSRLAAVLTSPAKTFQSIAERPTWLVAVLVLITVGLASMLVASPKIDWEDTVRTQLEQSGTELDEDQIATQVGFAKKFGTVMIFAATLVFPWIIYPLMALIFLGAMRVFGSEINFKSSLSVFVHSLMPWAVATVLAIPVTLARSELTPEDLQGGLLASNLGAFAGEDTGAVLTSVLQSLDVFSVWTMILLTIGYSIVAKVSRSSVATVVVGLWLTYVAGKAGLAALGAMAGG